MMNIGIIGAGEMGTCLASKFVKLGHTVSIANSRGPASLKQFTDDSGAAAATVEGAITNNEVIIVSIPVKMYRISQSICLSNFGRTWLSLTL